MVPVTQMVPVAPVIQVVPEVGKIQEMMDHQRTNDYRCVCVPNLKRVYLKLLNDNIVHLIESIYVNRDKIPYNSTETRVALSMQMILSSDQLIPFQLSTQIAKDLDDLRKNEEYTKRWANPAKKRKQLVNEIEMLKKHTEIDDSISLNLADQQEVINTVDFDIHSGVSTLNVSAECPIQDEDGRGNCLVM
jgi:hypothetical protein